MSRGNTYSIPRDANRVPALLAVSTIDGATVVALEANPATGALIIEGTVTPAVSPNNGISTDTIDDNGTLIMAANANRTGGTIYNAGPNSCFITLGTTPTITDYTVIMVVGAYYELPFNYTGDVSAICNTAETADLKIGEFS